MTKEWNIKAWNGWKSAAEPPPAIKITRRRISMPVLILVPVEDPKKGLRMFAGAYITPPREGKNWVIVDAGDIYPSDCVAWRPMLEFPEIDGHPFVF